MALRIPKPTGIIADHENIDHVQRKIVKQPTRRPALNELSNKVIGPNPPTLKEGPSNIVLKRQESLKITSKENAPATKETTTNSLSISRASVDPDLKDKDDPQMATEYVKEIYQFLLEAENRFLIRENFLENHATKPRMRAILVNWLDQIHSHLKLSLDTLYIGVSILDRYLQIRKDVGKETLQLIGTTCLYVACKYEEIYFPDISDFEYVCDKTYSCRQILKAERDILTTLDFCLGKPLPIHFLRRFNNIAQFRQEQHNLSKYLLELALLDSQFSSIAPSKQAAAACFLTKVIYCNTTCPSQVWSSHLTRYTNYKYSEIEQVVASFANMLLTANTLKHQNIQSKYADSKYNKISTQPKLQRQVVKVFAKKKPVAC